MDLCTDSFILQVYEKIKKTNAKNVLKMTEPVSKQRDIAFDP
ncbi:hypothetical protein ES702_06329 [subsurface metagenome]